MFALLKGSTVRPQKGGYPYFTRALHGNAPASGSGQQFFNNSRAESGRIKKCSKPHGSGRVGSGRVGSGRVGSGRVGSGRVGSGRAGQRAFHISRFGPVHYDPIRPASHMIRPVKSPDFYHSYRVTHLYRGFSRVMHRPAGRVRRVSITRGSSRVGSGQQGTKPRESGPIGSGRVGSGDFQI